ncbi:peptidoglycan hydrolase [Anaerobacillus arseniciselenatis]|uniref:Peptidoglycan hydrolase n=1 Tax=Anaerobacillus arseniciselenatis TaxID=85682 RepID=A0A1S2LKC5_9BACI|nr:glycosyl hydrolase family 18 protein [Anaerobacillus arseniciselenatis]OIJ12826.1 peptidoglycan hydrolase [Anaerobacillus arseniciselenatis]
MSKRSRKETHKKSKIPLLLIVLSITTIFLIALFSMYYYFESQQKQVSYFQKENPIIFQGEIYEKEALYENNQLYIPLQLISDYLDDGVTFDEDTESVIIISNENILRFPIEKLEKFVNEQSFNIEVETLITSNEELYVEMDQLENIYPIHYNFYPEVGSVVISSDGEEQTTGIVKENTKHRELRLKTKPSYFSDYYAKVDQGEKVYIMSEEVGHYFVRNEIGISGFIKKDVIENVETSIVTIERDDQFRQLQYPESPINLTWEAVYQANPDTNELPEMPGINVVSPTWFKLKNEEGDIHSLASMTYVDWAKDRGYQIWGLFSNDFDPDKTHVALQNFETRQKMIRQLLQYSEMYDLDGINVDFENVYLKDRDLVTQFVRELTALAHQAGLIISMDITFISSSEMWSMFYDRKALAEIVDYMVVMAYDEHWGTSPIAGSVASFPWVERNLEILLEEIPNERLILGIPTYTRIWEERETEGGNIEVSSRALSMRAVEEWIEERELTPVFDETSGQDYVEFYDENEQSTYKIWIENADSIARRGQMVHDYNLAGVASWNRFFSNDESWEALDAVLNNESVE